VADGAGAADLDRYPGPVLRWLRRANDTLGDFVGDDVSPLQSAIDRILNSPGSMLFNIDYDNDTNNEAFILAKDRMGDSGGTELMRVQENGRVGIGTNNPLERFQVADDFYVDSAASFTGVNRNARVTGAEYFGIQAPTGDNVYGGMYIRTDGAGGWPFYGYANSGGGGMWTYYDGTAEKWHVNMGGNRLTVDGSNGNVGIGDTTPAATLTVGNGDKFQVNGSQGDVGFVDDQASITFPATDAINSPMVHMFASGTTNGDRMVIAHSPSFPTWGVQYQDNGDQFNFLGGGTSAMTVELGSRRVGINTDSPGRTLDVNGTARVSILEIAGADLAEAFPFSAREETIEPGSVVAIDPENPGELCLARGAYNTCVAGVIAGANDFSTGVVLGADPATEHLNKHPVALSGRVYVKCDASNGAIRPGDMLTTSDRPGYAMKVTEHDRARGAVIGKAMSALEGGEGMVLVLVTLQ